jgi:putative intracellular protease/amidase
VPAAAPRPLLRIAIPVFEGLTALDAIGPYEVLSRLPGASVTFLAAGGSQPGRAIRTENGMLGIIADAALDALPAPDVIVVPGGFGIRALLEDDVLVGWLRAAHATSRWTTSVCTGSLLLGAAGLLGDLVGHDARDGLGATGFVVEPGRFGTWMIGPAGALLVRSGGRRVQCYCVHATGEPLPRGDRIAHLLLALRADESGFATVANLSFSGARWRVRRCLAPDARAALDAAGTVAGSGQRRATGADELHELG